MFRCGSSGQVSFFAVSVIKECEWQKVTGPEGPPAACLVRIVWE